MKQTDEYVRGLRYKLRMCGVLDEGIVYISGDNQSMLVNYSMPKSTIKKTSLSITYHFIHEGCKKDESRTSSYVRACNGLDNEASC